MALEYILNQYEQKGKIIKSKKDLKANDKIEIRFVDGKVEAGVL